MSDGERSRYLSIALRAVGAFSIFGFYPFTVIWPSGWVWHGGQPEYLQMLIAIYATLGVFLIVAARDPDQHVGVVSFAIWSSIVHGSVMAVQALVNPQHVGHLYGDVLVLLVVGALLGFLSPRAFGLPFARPNHPATRPN